MISDNHWGAVTFPRDRLSPTDEPIFPANTRNFAMRTILIPMLLAGLIYGEEVRTAQVAGITVTYLPAPLPQPMAPGPYQPTWESLGQYRHPAWFRDAKFGIWAHWGPQCMPEAGDWYAKNMYIQGKKQYDEHVRRFGHPSEFGFKDICNAWKAENFNPERLVEIYRRAGAKYFVAMANHHDNFDLWDSLYQPWNSVAIGPKQNLVGRWAEAARKNGLRFGVSVHASNTWNWFEVSQGRDATGPKAGVPYDGNLTKADGKGTWWEGLDPQDLYAQNHRPSDKAGQKVDLERKFPGEPVSVQFATKYCNRVRDLVDRYQPDLVYFDDFVLPLAMRTDAAYGLALTAHIYNQDQARHGGRNEVVVNTKILDAQQSKCLVRDYEMAAPDQIQAEPWQTDACIGRWHYAKGVRYRTATQVVRALADVVSKNGNLLLNVPLRSDGTPDDDELAVVQGIGDWLTINGEAIYDTRPWTTFGEGPSLAFVGTQSSKGGTDMFSPKLVYTAEDIRFTTKGRTLYAIALAWPADGRLRIRSLAEGGAAAPGSISAVRLLGTAEALTFTRTADGLDIVLPAKPAGAEAYALRIEGALSAEAPLKP